MTSTIYKKEYMEITIRNLPPDHITCYGCNTYIAMAASRTGTIYIEDKIYIHTALEISWSDIKDLSLKGSIKSYSKLKKVGYTKRQIRSIYSQRFSVDFFGRRLNRNKMNKGNILGLLWEISYSMRKVPFHTIKIWLRLLNIYMIQTKEKD